MSNILKLFIIINITKQNIHTKIIHIHEIYRNTQIYMPAYGQQHIVLIGIKGNYYIFFMLSRSIIWYKQSILSQVAEKTDFKDL